ncbi:cupin domain-containing protein [Acidihalobacter aeolianus]|uniref:cupin domain-containing protein n=1 Tax=Acidihalobacter aeolianus TaxID=2792603 RepID=UPI0018D2BE8B|nr:cupin domain-containing protein [Acidihalobacter aeolianus]
MRAFETLHAERGRTETAPDGSRVRVLLGLDGGSMARFELPAGGTSSAVFHRSAEEIWYVLEGRGELWRRQEDREEIVALRPGLCVSLPLGTRFQFRAAPDAPLAVLAVTLPPWPGDGEALPVAGPWPPDAT